MTTDRFQIEVHATETVPTIRVSGEFDLSATEPFRAEAKRLLQRELELVVVDLRDLTFLDSTGLTELIWLYKQAEERDFTLAILRPPPNVAVLFELTGLDQHHQPREAARQPHDLRRRCHLPHDRFGQWPVRFRDGIVQGHLHGNGCTGSGLCGHGRNGNGIHEIKTGRRPRAKRDRLP